MTTMKLTGTDRQAGGQTNLGIRRYAPPKTKGMGKKLEASYVGF